MENYDFKKQYGQNFLNNVETIISFTDLADIKKGDIVLEIGPGDGAITEAMLSRGAKVTAVEIDPDLFDILRNRFKGNDELKLINEDILKLDIKSLGIGSKYKLVSALPYNISKRIILKFLNSIPAPEIMLVIMQKEVAEDYTSLKGQRRFLNIFAQTFARDVQYLGTIKKEDFIPIPKVDGGIVRFKKIKNRFKDTKYFLRFVKAGFISPRKKLSSNLCNVGYIKTKIESDLVDLGLSRASRAGELSFEQWVLLYKKADNGIKNKE